jgi:hypothetical protein
MTKKVAGMAEDELKMHREKKRLEMKAYLDRRRAGGETKTGRRLPPLKVSQGYNHQIARMYVNRYLEEHPCVDCGYSNPMALEFDHVRGKKLFGIGDAIGAAYPLVTIVNEIAKCEIRCANCHRVRHKTK